MGEIEETQTLRHLSVVDLTAHVKSTDLHSGGGTAAAIVAALAVASANLVTQLNARRRSNRDRADEFEQIERHLEKLRYRMLGHAERDAEVLERLMAAYAERKQGNEESDRFIDLLTDAADSGIQLLTDIDSFLKTLSPELSRTPLFLLSDVGAAAALALGASQAASLTTLANISELRRSDHADEADRIEAQLNKLVRSIQKTAGETYSAVSAALSERDTGRGVVDGSS